MSKSKAQQKSRTTATILAALCLAVSCGYGAPRTPSPENPRLCVVNRSLDVQHVADEVGHWFRVYPQETRCEFFRIPNPWQHLYIRGIVLEPFHPGDAPCWTWEITTVEMVNRMGPFPDQCLRERHDQAPL